jgi:hypothetical protein
MASLRNALSAIAASPPVRVPSAFHGPRPPSVLGLFKACVPPQMAAWSNPERAFAENKDWTEELNGIVTDGHAWYASSNADDDREGVYKLTMGFGFVAKIKHPGDADDVHIGALAVRDGQLFVPTQASPRRGVWIVDTDFVFSASLFAEDPLPHDDPSDMDDLFAWCDVNPHNGLIYTSNFSEPKKLYAYEPVANTLVRREKQDIPLRQPSDGRPTTNVQGACFTPNFKWIAVCDVDEDERIHCHSTLTGAFLDRRLQLADTNDEAAFDRNELEGIWFAPMTTGRGNHVQVHVLELNNDTHSPDDMYLWQYSVPPDAL